ncbi:nuclear envelope integral membrane protein 1-like [Actinia tenebrosa]|uniref:Nuclear envelope integral membrane protein 1-like n=1 Tax=Actinia tenebrosa TaxID=6105 RepID=A0A6P8J551_ACTTE|nr:nuclear envelope integral membrane protein 1-like [Actinia tenebrosa]
MAEERKAFSLSVLLFLSGFILHGSRAASSSCTDVRMKDLLYIGRHHFRNQPPYCIKGYSHIHPLHIWSSIRVDLKFDIEGYRLFQADSCKTLNEVRSQTFAKRILAWFADPDAITSNYLYLSPFGDTCFDISSRKEYETNSINVELTFQTVNWHLPLSFIVGLILFLEANRLSRSATFYYSSGIVLGVGVSLLLAVFLLHRLLPSKGGAYALLAGGWSVSLYLLQWTWNNLVDLVLDRNPIVIGYFTVAGIISFCLCYYNGPVTNQRGIDLIRWTIRLIASYFIYKGIQPESLSLVVVVIVIVCYSIKTSGHNVIEKLLVILPKSWISYKVWYYFFPPSQRLLTREEFDSQGVVETRRALDELREYCNSPECDAWKVISRVRNPKRFCAFVNDGLHITDEEYEQFEENPFVYTRPDEHDDDAVETEGAEEKDDRYFERCT